MAKPVGDVTLESGDSLYTNLLGVMPFTDRPAGPARLIEPGSPDVAYDGTFASLSGTEDDAWPDTGDPYFACDAATSSRKYTWTRCPISTLPLTIGIHYYSLIGSTGRIFWFYESGDTSTYFTLSVTNASGGLIFGVSDGTTLTQYTKATAGLVPLDTWHSIVITLADDGSGNVDITGVYIDKSEIAGSQDANNAVWSSFALDRMVIGTDQFGGYVKGYIGGFAIWGATLSGTLINKWHDDFQPGSTPTYNLLVAPPAIRYVTGAMAGVDASFSSRDGIVAPAFYRGPGLSYPTAPRIGVNAAGRGFSRGIR